MNLSSRLLTLSLCLFYVPLDYSMIANAQHGTNRSTIVFESFYDSIKLQLNTSSSSSSSSPSLSSATSLTSFTPKVRKKRTIGAPEKWATLLDLFTPKPCSKRNTRFYLYTRRNRVKAQELCINDPTLLRNSHFDPRKKTIILASGWLDNRFFARWVREGLKALLNRGDYNVIYVAWRSIKELFVAAFVIKIYSEDLSKFVNFVKYSSGISTDSIHCIGHSLGAFICAFASETAKMRRVTVLDAGPRPYYEKMHWSKRINRFQADQFIDVIHSDFNPKGFSLGLTIPVGDIDFFPNAGTIQEGCWRDKWYRGWKALKEDNLLVSIDQFARYSLFCSHYRAHEWFFESIENHRCQFVGVLCPTYEMFLAGECACDSYTKHPYTCAPMGFDADSVLKNSPKQLIRFFPQGKWYLKTSDFLKQTDRHCQFQYQVMIKLGEIQPIHQNGTFRISFVVKNGARLPPQVISHESVAGSKKVGIRSNYRVTKLMIRQSALPLKRIIGIYVSYHSNHHYSAVSTYGGSHVSVSWVKLSPIIMRTPPMFFCDNNLTADRIRSMTGTHFMSRCKKPK